MVTNNLKAFFGVINLSCESHLKPCCYLSLKHSFNMQLSGAQHTRDLQQTHWYLLEHTKTKQSVFVTAFVCVSVRERQSDENELRHTKK